MHRVFNLYRSSTGEHVAPESLSPAEAVSLHQSGELYAVDFGRLSAEAGEAVGKLMPRPRRNGVMVFAFVRNVAA